MKKLTVIPGEGIGPEIMNSAIQILQSVQAPFDFEFHDVGEVALRKHKHFFPEAAMAAIQRNSLVLKGPIATVNLKFMVADKFGFFSEVLTKQSAIANIGIISVFEPAHGPLPEIAGLGKANPTALIQSAVMLLEHIGEIKKAQSIFLALNSCAQDMGGKDNTHVFTKALIHKLNA